MVGQSAAFLKMTALMTRIAACDAPVLLEGETGTGKELVARAIHYQGHRRDRPFVPVNCGALPDLLVENELFGHRRGAFTDARGDQPGLLARADGGTLFLDEVEALSAKGQVTLLRFLQDRHYRPLGDTREQASDVRIVAASKYPPDPTSRGRPVPAGFMVPAEGAVPGGSAAARPPGGCGPVGRPFRARVQRTLRPAAENV